MFSVGFRKPRSQEAEQEWSLVAAYTGKALRRPQVGLGPAGRAVPQQGQGLTTPLASVEGGMKQKGRGGR